MKVFKKIIKIFLLTIIFIIFYSFFYSLYENIKINQMVDQFKNRSTLVEVEDVSAGQLDYKRMYFEVPRETTAELNDKNSVFYDRSNYSLGISGDIFATRQSPFPTIPVFHELLSFYAGGHAAMINFDEFGVPMFAEATGFPTSNESIFDYIFHDGLTEHNLHSTLYNNSLDYWQKTSGTRYYYNQFYRTEYFGLRAVNHFVGTDKEHLYDDYVNAAVDSVLNKIEEERIYNFLFFLNTKNKYYCTDLMSRVYEEAYERVYNENLEYNSYGYGRKMNDDGLITSVQDLILSRDTFMTFYVEVVEELYEGEKTVIEKIYFLADPQ